jgi:type IV pilus assembly protein PilM
MPRAAGVDISDSSIKWLALEPAGARLRVSSYGELALESGIVVSGVIRDVSALSAALSAVKEELGGIAYAHAALPEEAAYVFSMSVPYPSARDQVLRIIEFEFEGRVPIPPSAAVYDYNEILPREIGGSQEVSVSVFPQDMADAYGAAFAGAGIELLSLEIEARSIARAVSTDASDDPITLLVDFGLARSGFAVLKRGYPIFTSTVEVGGDTMTKALMEKLSITAEQAESYKNEQGLMPDDGPAAPGLEAITGTASALADEVARHYHYWDTRRNEHGDRMTPVGDVVLVGGSANLRGLAEYISGRVQAPVERGNIWRNVAPFDEYIPPIDRRHSLQYATATGLALRGLI